MRTESVTTQEISSEPDFGSGYWSGRGSGDKHGGSGDGYGNGGSSGDMQESADTQGDGRGVGVGIGGAYWPGLYGGGQGFLEYRLQLELNMINKMPKSDLPLIINSLEFEESKTLLESRLKEF